ncbi:MAG: CinA family protein [Desulfobacterales bacterium]|nr:CinA family protein [Desulfobacterales bacterium]
MNSGSSNSSHTILSPDCPHHNQKAAEAVQLIGERLGREQATLAVAESCTGGLVSHWLTNVAGSSDYFLFSAVTYSNDAKISMLGVSPETLDKFGSVHIETAKEMARGVRSISKATYGLSTTGIAGPGGGSREKPVGTVCVGLAAPDAVKGVQYHFSCSGRVKNKEAFAAAALELLKNHLLSSCP